MTMHGYIGKLTPSKENYLKVMLELPSKEGIRSTDIANALGVSKASVSSMMNILREAGYVTKEKYGTVSLTKNGQNAAAEVKKRNELLKRFLHNFLGVEASIAAEDACRLEHLISPETADQIARQLKKLSE
ncbi:MAG TPA: metal-dependent transcriptional regulator [Bacilli bacterium]|nr:metal-dependent transcriptional regulator [Bacilli bacterium]